MKVAEATKAATKASPYYPVNHTTKVYPLLHSRVNTPQQVYPPPLKVLFKVAQPLHKARANSTT